MYSNRTENSFVRWCRCPSDSGPCVLSPSDSHDPWRFDTVPTFFQIVKGTYQHNRSVHWIGSISTIPMFEGFSSKKHFHDFLLGLLGLPLVPAYTSGVPTYTRGSIRVCAMRLIHLLVLLLDFISACQQLCPSRRQLVVVVVVAGWLREIRRVPESSTLRKSLPPKAMICHHHHHRRRHYCPMQV